LLAAVIVGMGENMTLNRKPLLNRGIPVVIVSAILILLNYGTGQENAFNDTFRLLAQVANFLDDPCSERV
jgi:hypothetical protein